MSHETPLAATDVGFYTEGTSIGCCRDLATRAPVVSWEGVTRIAAFFLTVAIFLDAGVMVAVVGAVDLIIGLVHLIGLPRALLRGVVDLPLDGPAQAPAPALR